MMKKMVKKKRRRITIEISYKTIFFTLVLLLALWFLYLIRDVLFLFFVSLILMGALNPTVVKMEHKGISRGFAILIIYIVLLLVLAGVLAGLIPPMAQQIGDFLQNFPSLLARLPFASDLPGGFLSAQVEELIRLPSGIIKFTFSFFSGLVTLIVTLVVTFYLLLEHRHLDTYLFDLFGEKGRERGGAFIKKLERTLGNWVRAEIILMTFIGTISYLGFLVLRLKYALPLALLAGLLEVIPNIGPTVAAIPAVFMGLLVSPLIGLLTLLWGVIVQQVENNFLVPRVMNKVVDVNPVVTILSLAIGLRIGGVTGAILAIPVYLTVRTLIQDFVVGDKSSKKIIKQFGQKVGDNS